VEIIGAPCDPGSSPSRQVPGLATAPYVGLSVSLLRSRSGVLSKLTGELTTVRATVRSVAWAGPDMGRAA
jgi:hypothetical protein